jgi:tetratricopeptide (TPR) repeat protein
LLFVLVLYGIKIHQRLMDRTRITFGVSLHGQEVFGIRATLDGKQVMSGEHISLGRHVFIVSHEKGVPFTTNLFTWYGGHNLGKVDLSRAMGTLNVWSEPKAAWVSIRGPEFQKVLTNTFGGSFAVPTDRYDIDARYAFNEETATADVGGNVTSSARLAPMIAKAQVKCSQSNTKFFLRSKTASVQVGGDLPASIEDVPCGSYELMFERLGQREVQNVSVVFGRTNLFEFAFSYGAAIVETEPSGAEVLDSSRRLLGKTPLVLTELRAGAWQFSLEKSEHEAALLTVDVVVGQTNHTRTNLLTERFATSIRAARTHLASRQYAEALEAAKLALAENPNDQSAKEIAKQSSGMRCLDRGKSLANRGAMTEAIEEMGKCLEILPENNEAKTLLADYTARKGQIEEETRASEAKQQTAAERSARIEEARKHLQSACSRYDNAALFSKQELFATNDVQRIGDTINRVLKETPHKFDVHKYEWTPSKAFVLEAKEDVSDGFRQAVVVGTQCQTNECFICFKVIEFQTPHSVNILNGLITAHLTTPGDTNGERKTRYQIQIAEGAPMLNAKVLRAIREAGQGNANSK